MVRHVLATSRFGGGSDVRCLDQEPPVRHRVYAFVAAGVSYILKVFQSAAARRAEVTALEALAGRRVPQVVEVGEGPAAGWMITSFMPGVSEWPALATMPAAVFEALGREVAAIHIAGVARPYGSLWDADQQFVRWADYIDASFAEGIAFLSNDVCATDLRDWTELRYRSLREELGAVDARGLLHRDLRAANIRIEDTATGWQLVGIIDFEHAMIGDPWLDLSRLEEELLDGAGAAHAEAFWRGYEPRLDRSARAHRMAMYRVLRYVRGVKFSVLTRDEAFREQHLDKLRALRAADSR